VPRLRRSINILICIPALRPGLATVGPSGLISTQMYKLQTQGFTLGCCCDALSALDKVAHALGRRLEGNPVAAEHLRLAPPEAAVYRRAT